MKTMDTELMKMLDMVVAHLNAHTQLHHNSATTKERDMCNQTLVALSMDQGLDHEAGDKVITFNPDTDLEWMTEEQAGEVLVDEGYARRILARAQEKQAKGEFDILFDDPSPELYNRMEEPTCNDKEFWAVEEAVTKERELLVKAIRIGKDLKVPWSGTIRRWDAVRKPDGTVVRDRQGNIKYGVQYRKVKTELTQEEAWGPVNRFNKREQAIKETIHQAHYQRPVDKAALTWYEKELEACQVAKDMFFWQYLNRALKDINPKVKVCRDMVWQARDAQNEIVKEKAAEVEDFWWRRRLILEEDTYTNTWQTCGEVTAEFDDFLLHSKALNRGVDLAFDHIRAGKDDELEGSKRWGYYERDHAGNVIKENIRRGKKERFWKSQFYQVLKDAKASKSIPKQRNLLNRLANLGKIYWWTKPEWYVNAIAERNKDVKYKNTLAMDPEMEKMWSQLDEEVQECPFECETRTYA